jgi:HSP20 family molecular chaperone IbpA
MVRRFHRSIYDELDELRASMDYLYQLALEPDEIPVTPRENEPGLVCRYLHNLDPEVTVHEDEVTVTVDMARGTGPSKISLDLISETRLKISCDREEEELKGRDVDPNRRRSFSLHHLVTLPAPVVDHGAKVNLRNGVLDIHLKKARAALP